MKLDMSADSIMVARLPYRHSRVGSIRYIVLLAGCLASLAVVLLIAGAIMTTLIFTEVRPPTADENYNRYLGSDWRSVIGPLLMGTAAVMIIMGCALTVMGYRSANEDRLVLSRDAEREFKRMQTMERLESEQILPDEVPPSPRSVGDPEYPIPDAKSERWTTEGTGRKVAPSLIPA